MSFNSVAIVAIGENWDRIRFWFVTKSKGVDKKKNNDLSGKSGKLWFKKKLLLWKCQIIHRRPW